jgi:hypothetical protein
MRRMALAGCHRTPVQRDQVTVPQLAGVAGAGVGLSAFCWYAPPWAVLLLLAGLVVALP